MMLRKFGHTLFVSALMLAGACFTACDDSVIDDNTDGEPVQMFASIASRNAVESRFVSGIADYEKIKFEKDDKINVDAWHFSGSNGERTSEPNFFIDQEMIYDGSAWNYTPIKYWPNYANEKLAVCAYNDCASTKDNFCVKTKDSANGYTMKFDDCGHVDDVVVAPLTEYSRSQLDSGRKIPITFYHIMSLVKMQVKYITKAGADPNDNYLTIKNIELHWHSKGGTFTGFAEVDGIPEAQWTEVEKHGNYVSDVTDYTIEANKDFKDLPGMTFCQIPFTSPFMDSENVVRYTRVEIIVGFDDEPNDIKFVKELSFELKPGKTTVFNVLIDGKDIDVTVSNYLEWSGDGGSTTVTF